VINQLPNLPRFRDRQKTNQLPASWDGSDPTRGVVSEVVSRIQYSENSVLRGDTGVG
jgi:hypothetical protein